jgi:uncharacterized protein
MLSIMKSSGSDLLLANLLLQSRGLVEKTKQAVQIAIDQQAWKTVETYMWGAGGAAALSPFPLVDIIAGAAINSKMVIDLGRIYQHDVDANTAVKLLGELGKNLIGILGVGLATPAIVGAIGSLLKTVPGIGTIVGGLMQGIVQALITRWIGAVFIDYFRSEMNLAEGGLSGLARRRWEELTTASELKKLVSQAREKLTGASKNS